jgi:RNA polymerase sigma-70 factor (ECF subfamily)
MDDGMRELTASTPVRAADLSRERGSSEELVRAFNEARAELVSTLYYLLGNHADAQDAAQDAFLKCWRSREGLQDVRSMRAWIFRVGVNAAKDLQRNAWRRRAKPLIGTPAQSEAATIAPLDALAHGEDMERLRQALLDLRPEEKAVFLLRQNGALTYEEIAELRHCPVGTIKTQMRAALQKLRRVLGETACDV